MKKILLLFAAAVCAVASWAADATVSATVKGQELKVALANDAQAFVAFQMDITLPTGVSVANDGTAMTLNTERLTVKAGEPVPGAANANFILAYNVIDATHVRVLAYNLENRALAGNSGELFTMTFDGTPGTDFTIDGIKFVTESSLNEVDLAQIQSTVGADVLLGDINMDGKVDGDDVTAAAAVYLGTINYAVDLKAGDVNGDTVVDGDDIVLIAKIYLGI